MTDELDAKLAELDQQMKQADSDDIWVNTFLAWLELHRERYGGSE